MRLVLTCSLLALVCGPASASDTATSTDLATTADMVARYPKTEMNATAAALVRSAADLELDLAPGTFTPGWCREASAVPNREMWYAAFWYLQHALAEPESIEPPPQVLADFVSAHHQALDSIRMLLLREPAPRWTLDIERWWRDPQPSPHLAWLRSLLLAEALVAADAGDSATSLSWLEAAWKLGEGLRSGPDFFGWRMSFHELAILRRVDPPGEAWTDVWTGRLAQQDPRADLRAWQLVEAWIALGILAEDQIPLTEYQACIEGDFHPGLSSALDFVLTSSPVRAYGRAGTVEATARLRTLLDRLVKLDPCELMAGDYPLSLAESDPWWNLMGGLAFAQQNLMWGRVGRAQLETELTAKVLEARRLKALTGAWPASIPGIETSACKRGSWRYSAPRGGGVLIEFVTDGDWARPRPGREAALRDPGPLRFCSAK